MSDTAGGGGPSGLGAGGAGPAVDDGELTITVDGRTMKARPGELVIAVAERNGVYIPRFCYHPRMKPVGMCRMCLVDIAGPRGFQLQPACFVPVADGQEVVTDSPAVKKAQDGVLELLLVNHPLDCPVCDRGGECPLQDQTFAYGPGESRFVEEKRHWEKPIPLSGLVALDRERCIQCARCTRFAEEIAGDPLIDFVGRSDHTEVNTFPDAPFASYFSGNTVQICPVGALTAFPYRFKARPWDLDQVESTCTSCAVGCRVTIQSSSNRVTRYLGVDSDPVNHGWLCDKGRFDYEHLTAEDRLTGPLVRAGDQLRPATWDEAMEVAVAGLRRAVDGHGPGAVAVLGGARLTNEDAYAWAKLAKSLLGTDNVDSQLGDGLPAELVLGVPRATIEETCEAGAVILLGPDLKEELPVLYLRLRQAALDGGAPLIEVSPVVTGLSRYATVRLHHRPGEAAAVLRTLMQRLGQTDVGNGAGASDGPGGVSEAALDRAVEVLRQAGAPDAARRGVVVVLGRPSVAESPEPTVDAATALMTGWPEAMPELQFLPALRRGNVHGALEMGLAPGVLPGRVSLTEGRAWFEKAWGRVPSERGLDAAGVLEAAAAGRVHALVLLGADPLSDFPDRALARRALAAIGHIVAVDLFPNPSVRQADVVLAAAGYAERGGTSTNLEGRITRLGQKVTAPGTVRSDWIIAAELASRLGGDLEFEGAADIWAEIERVAPSCAGITAGVLARPDRRDGVVAPLGSHVDAHRGPAAPLLGSDIETRAVIAHLPVPEQPMPGPEAVGAEPAAETEATPTAAEQMPASADRPALLTFDPAAGDRVAPPVDAYALRLVSGRRLYDEGAVVSRCPSLSSLAVRARLMVNPYDLERLGVSTGDRVRAVSSRAALEVEVHADAGIPRGSASLPFNLPGLPAAELVDATNPVTDVRLETLSRP